MERELTLSYARGNQTFASPNLSMEEVEPLAVVVNGLKPETIAYLLQYGWAQSLQDSIAGKEKKAIADIKSRIAEGLEAEMDEDEIAAQAAMDVEAALAKRQKAILEGTVAVREAGEAKDPLRAVALDMIRNAAKAKGKKLTKDQLATLADEILADENRRAKVQAEFDKRKEAQIEVEI